jgi:transcriptional regulator with XRE-family HTH domain
VACMCQPTCRCESVPLRSRGALRDAIRDARSSQRALARAVGVSGGMISQLATGRREACTVGVAEKIAAELGAELGDLFDLSRVSRLPGRVG